MPLQILFVDDSVTMQRAMQITFSREDAEVSCVADGSSALAQAQQRRPDVIVIDTTLSQGDGYAVCTSLKAHPNLAQVPVVLLANKQNPIDEARLAACGAESHSSKPFDTQSMIDRVRALANLPVIPAAAPASWTPRPAAQAPVAQAPQAPLASMAPSTAAPPRRPTAPSTNFPATQAPATLRAPTQPPISVAAPAQTTPRPVVQTPAVAPPPQRAPTPQPMTGAWSMTPAPAGSGPQTTAPGAPAQRTVSGAPPAAFRAPPAAAPRQAGPRAPQAPMASMAQTASQLATQSVGQALHKAGIPVDQAALMTLAREIIERVAWEVVPELAETVIREQLARQQKP